MILLHISKTIPKRCYYIPLKQYQNHFIYIPLKQYQKPFYYKMVLVILEVCNQNRFGIVLEVCNKIVLVLFQRYVIQSFWYCFRGM
jgi:hypothetical protein